MLNPDGVYNGNYRLDSEGQNLNRFYKQATFEKQPSIYAVRKLVEFYQKQKRFFFYLDLHAHAGKKGHFVYGNAFKDIESQIETQLFAKLVELNCKHFEYNFCNFSIEQMYAKNKNDESTKEGSGRVQI